MEENVRGRDRDQGRGETDRQTSNKRPVRNTGKIKRDVL